MATSVIKQGFTSTERLTLTYTQNAYVSETDFNRMRAYKKNGVLWLYANLTTSVADTTTSDMVEIGRISGWNAISDVFQCVSGQSDASKGLLIVVRIGGAIQIYGNGATKQYYRTSITALSS